MSESEPIPTRATSKQRSKQQVEESEIVGVKKQPKSTYLNLPSAKNAIKITSKPVVDTKSGKKVVPSVKVQNKKEEDELKGLEELYYGVRDGLDDYYENYPNNGDMSVQLSCPICKVTQFFATNTQLQKHLYTHIDVCGVPYALEWKAQCQFCLLKLNDADELKKHQQCVHKTETRCKSVDKSTLYNCLICEESFLNLQNLTLHMQKMHNILELPYNCQTCGYRTSAHCDIIKHFNEDHHQHNFLQCPLCLDIYHFSNKGQLYVENIQLYVVHLRQHAARIQQKTQLNCQKCVLKFIDKGAMKMHGYYYHTSWYKNTQNIRPLCESLLLIPQPKVRSHHREQLQFTVLEKYGEFFAFIEGSICTECNCEIINEEHFPALMKCNKCNFKTCCERTIFTHICNCNGETDSRFATELPLANEIHCVCGFSTAIGNKMAEHLANCGQKSAYPSLEVAVENTVKRNMLDMLGLVRRDGDSTGDNSESQKSPDADVDGNTPTVPQDTIPFLSTEAIADDNELRTNEQSYTRLVNAAPITSDEVGQYQAQLDFVAPQIALASGEIDMPLIGDLVDSNNTVAPGPYLNDVHTPMFDAIAVAEQQHYHQIIHEPTGESQ